VNALSEPHCHAGQKTRGTIGLAMGIMDLCAARMESLPAGRRPPAFCLKTVRCVLGLTPVFLLQVERRPLKKRKSEAVGGPREAPGEAESGSEVTRSDDLPIIAGARESKAVTSKRAPPHKKTPLPPRKPAEPLAFQGEDAAIPRAPLVGHRGRDGVLLCN
jgi:hypothetical protein